MKDNAQSVASAALPKSGGTMTGNIQVGNGCNIVPSNSQNTIPIYSGISLLSQDLSSRINKLIFSGASSNNPQGYGVFMTPYEYSDVDHRDATIQLRGISAPTAAHDAANKAYVDSKAGGLNPQSPISISKSTSTAKVAITQVSACDYLYVTGREGSSTSFGFIIKRNGAKVNLTWKTGYDEIITEFEFNNNGQLYWKTYIECNSKIYFMIQPL